MCAVWDLFAAGGSIAFHRFDRHVPNLARLCHEISADISGPSWVNAYISPPGQGALSAHRDDHHVLVAQISGRKIWQFDTELEIETYGEGRSIHPAEQPMTILTGDLLFIPTGMQHEACGANEVSIHLTFGFRRANWHELLQKAAESLGDAWRKPALRPDDPAFPEAVESLVSDLHTTLLRLEIADRSLCSLPGGLNGEIVSVALDEGSVLRGARDHGFTARREGDSLVLHNGRRRITIPGILESMVSPLLSGLEIEIAEMAVVLDEPAWRKLASMLVREGIAAPKQ